MMCDVAFVVGELAAQSQNNILQSFCDFSDPNRVKFNANKSSAQSQSGFACAATASKGIEHDSIGSA